MGLNFNLNKIIFFLIKMIKNLKNINRVFKIIDRVFIELRTATRLV